MTNLENQNSGIEYDDTSFIKKETQESLDNLETNVALCTIKNNGEIEKGKISKELEDNVNNYLKFSNQVNFANYKQTSIPKFEYREIKNGVITGELVSHGQKETIIIYPDESGNNVKKIKILGLNQRYTNDVNNTCYEGFRIANLINFLKNDIKQHPQGSDYKHGIGTYGKYIWKNGEIKRNINIIGKKLSITQTVLRESTIKQYFPSLLDSNFNSAFLTKINNNVENKNQKKE